MLDIDTSKEGAHNDARDVFMTLPAYTSVRVDVDHLIL